MYYGKSSDGLYGFYDPAINKTIPGNAVEITDDQWLALLDGQTSGKIIAPDADGSPILIDPPPLGFSQKVASLKSEVQQVLDAKAQSNGYDDITSCCSYMNSTVPLWAADAKAANSWRDSVWAYVFSVMVEPLPDNTTLINNLPKAEAYGWVQHAIGA